jgi:hypothetical protein
MASLASTLSPVAVATAEQPKRAENRIAPWYDLLFGPGPLWMRILRWGQRNAV